MVVLREPSTTVRLTPNRIAQWRRETHDKYAQDYHHRWLCDPSAQATRNRFRQSLDPVTLRPAINTTLRWNLRRDFIGHSRKQREDEEALWYWHAKHHPPRAYMPIVLGDGPMSLPLSLREAPLDSPTSGCTLFPPSGVSETNGHLRDLYGTVPPVDFLRINRYLQGRTANMTALQKRQYTEKKVQEQVQRAAYVRRLQQQEIVSEHDVHQRFDDSASNVSARSYQRRKVPPQFSSALQSDAGSAALERRLELINRRRKPIPLDVDWTQYHMSDGTDTFSDGAERSLKCTANEEEFAKRQHRAGMRAQSREVGTAVSAPRHTRRMQLGKCAALHARNTEKQTDRANDTSHVKSTSRFHANIASSIHHARTVAKENQRDNNVSPPLEPLDLKSPSRNAPESALTEQCKTDEAGVRQNPGKHQPEGHGVTKSMVSEGLNDHRVAIPPANSKTSILKNRARCARPQSCAPRIVSYPQK